MSKSVLIMNTPSNCDDCMFHYNTYDENDCFVDKCMVLKDNHYNDMTIDGYTRKYDGCPLKELPNKQVRDYPEYDRYITGWDDGWDACLDEILGE